MHDSSVRLSRKRHHIRDGSLVFTFFLYLFFILLSLVFILPLYIVIVCSVSDAGIVAARNSLLLWPVGFNLDAYGVVLQNPNLLIGFKNTMLYLVLGTAMCYFVTLISAYTMSLKDLTGKKLIMTFFVIPWFFGGGLIPYFMLLNSLHLTNTIWVLTVPYAFSSWNMILMRTNFNQIPNELKEAAVIDGASDFTVLFRIFLPLSGAISAVLILYSVVGYWNMWYEPMIFINKRNMYPLQSVLRQILIDEDQSVMGMGGKMRAHMLANNSAKSVSILIKYANIVITTLPILCAYPFAQKYFVKGVLLGSVKG